MLPYSMDLRKRVVEAVDEGKMTKWDIYLMVHLPNVQSQSCLDSPTVAKTPRDRLDRSQATRLHGQQQQSRRGIAGTPGDARSRDSGCDAEGIAAEIRHEPQSFDHRTSAGEDGIHAQKKSLHASEQQRPDVQQKRAEFCEIVKSIDPAKLVFVDEAGATTSMTRLRGRAAAGGNAWSIGCRTGITASRQWRGPFAATASRRG